MEKQNEKYEEDLYDQRSLKTLETEGSEAWSGVAGEEARAQNPCMGAVEKQGLAVKKGGGWGGGDNT